MTRAEKAVTRGGWLALHAYMWCHTCRGREDSCRSRAFRESDAPTWMWMRFGGEVR